MNEFYIFQFRYNGQTQFCISVSEKEQIDRLFEQKLKDRYKAFPELALKMYYVEGLEKLKADIKQIGE